MSLKAEYKTQKNNYSYITDISVYKLANLGFDVLLQGLLVLREGRRGNTKVPENFRNLQVRNPKFFTHTYAGEGF